MLFYSWSLVDIATPELAQRAANWYRSIWDLQKIKPTYCWQLLPQSHSYCLTLAASHLTFCSSQYGCKSVNCQGARWECCLQDRLISFIFILSFSLVKKHLELRKGNMELIHELPTALRFSKRLLFSFFLFLGFAFGNLIVCFYVFLQKTYNSVRKQYNVIRKVIK